MAVWLEVVFAALAVLGTCAIVLLGLLTLVDRRASKMESKIEAARTEGRARQDRTDDKLDELSRDMSDVRESVAGLKGSLNPVDMRGLEIARREKRERRTN